MGKILDQQEVNLVAVRVKPCRAVQMVLEQGLQAFFAGQICGLKKLAQLMDLYLLIHFQEPLAGAFHGLLCGFFKTCFQILTSGQVDHKLASQCSI